MKKKYLGSRGRFATQRTDPVIQMQEHIVFRWMSLKSTIEYLGEWEMLYNPNFNCTEFDTIRNAAGSNNFVLSVKAWIERTGAIVERDITCAKFAQWITGSVLCVAKRASSSATDHGSKLRQL